MIGIRSRIVVALAMAAAASGLTAAHDGDRERLVEVRAAGRVVAPAALLVESREHGPLLRLVDLGQGLPRDLPRVVPVRWQGAMYLPLDAIPEHVRLDGATGVLELVGVAWPARPDPFAPSQLEPAAGAPALRTLPLPAAGPEAAESAVLAEAGVAPEFIPPDSLRPSPLTGDREAPGPIRRRDPLELPLLPEGEWQEWLLSVTLNGSTVSEGALFIQSQEGQWAARVVDLRAWRVRLDEDRILTFNGEPFYPLAAFPDAEELFDGSTLTLEITLPAESFEPTAIGRGRVSTVAPRAARGGFIDYDVLYLAGDGVRPRLDALLELGVFDQVGVLVTNFRAGDLGREEREFVRLDTTFIKDFPERRASLRLGDSLTAGGALGRPVRFGGIQLASNFATDPGFVTFPLPSIGGLAQQPSTAELFLDNTRRVVEQVPPGPFAIDNLPVVTGGGELQLRVTDLLGREQLITQGYYVSPRLLRAGLSEYSYELGFEREAFNRDSFAYDDPFVVGTHRYGLTDAITGEARLETGLERQAAGVGGSFLLGTAGLVGAGVVGSRDDDAGTGFESFAEYEYLGRLFNFGLRTRYSHEGFRQLGLGGVPAARRVDQAQLGFGLGGLGRLGLLFVNSEARTGVDRQAVSANYSVPLGPGTLLVNGLQTLEPDEELALAATYSVPLGPIRSMSASASWRENASSGSVQYRRGRGASDIGPSYRLATEVGDNPRLFDGTLRYDAPLASGQLDLAHADGDTRVRANVSGSAAYVDGKAGLTRRLGRAFGMVALPGYPDITVYLENREVGKTDAEGYLLLPRLNPYQANRVRIQAEDLPLTAELDGEEQIAVPFDRSGVQIAFAVRAHKSALATLTDRDGEPLPAGLELVSADGRLSAQVADAGLAYIRGEAEGEVAVESRPGQPAYHCMLPELPEEPMAPLGALRCE